MAVRRTIWGGKWRMHTRRHRNDGEGWTLFRGGGERRLRVAELCKQRGLAGLGLGEVGVLDVAEAADVPGDRRQLDRQRVVGAVEPVDQLVDQGLVRADQRALAPAL